MIKLYDIIPLLNKEESRYLKIFLKRTNDHNTRKDIALFDYAKKNHSHINEHELLKQLYTDTTDKNSLYRLKNRLLSDINKSLLLLNYDKNEYINVINLISLSKIFNDKENYKIAAEYLIQAKQRAIKNEFFNLLDLIYSDLIKLPYEKVPVNPIGYIEKRKKNYRNIHVLKEIDDVLAVLVYRIKTSQNYSNQGDQFTSILKNTIDEFIDNDEVKKSPKLQFKIYHSISRILLQEKDFIALEAYLKLTYTNFSKKDFFNKSNHETKLQMLTYLVNALFKNNKIEASLKETQNLYDAMCEYDHLLFNNYLFYYYNSLVINYQVSDKKKAISVLLEAKAKKEIQELPFYVTFIYLNLSVLFFDTKDFKKARKNLAKLKLTDSFNTMDNVFRFKIGIFELLTFHELGDIDLFDYQLHQIRKEFHELLNEKAYQKEKMFISIIIKIDKLTQEELQQKVAAFTNLSYENEGIIDYDEWLLAKTQKRAV